MEKKQLLALLTILVLTLNVMGCASINEIHPPSSLPETPSVNESEIIKPEEIKPEIEIETGTEIPPTEETQTTSPSTEKNEDLESKLIPSRLFFYDIELDQMFYIDTDVEVIGGGYINSLTNALKNDNYGDHLITLAQETFVTKAEQNKETGLLTVYFNESFHESMNLGSISQVEMINALVNTYGYNYQVDKVAIIVEGKPYVDQRGELPEGYFTVTIDQAIKFE
ncbi:MAG: GerMN domain-containing protein [Turicibacter sp.]